MLELGAIRVPEGRRQVDRAVVDRLKRSIGRLGLMTPISVCERADFTEADLDALADLPPQLRQSEPQRKGRPPAYDLIAGLHRYMACLELGHAMIPVRVELGTGPETDPEQRARDMRLWEISENLDRAELSALERAEQIAEWVRLSDGQSAQFAPIGSKRQDGGGHRKAGGSNAAARRLGIERTEVQRAVKRAERIAPEVKAAIRCNPTIADSGVELDALASMPPEAQKAAVAAVKGGKAATVRDAAAKISRRIAAENPDAPAPPRTAPRSAGSDPVDRILALVKDLSACDFERLKARFREFCEA